MNDEIKEKIRQWYIDDDLISIFDYITNLQQENINQAKRNSRQRLANQKQQELILKLQQENERLKKPNYYEKGLIGSIKERDKIIQDYKSRCEKAIEYINRNKQKTICAYGDNEDDDFEICLWEEDIDNLLNILQNGGDKDE